MKRMTGVVQAGPEINLGNVGTSFITSSCIVASSSPYLNDKLAERNKLTKVYGLFIFLIMLSGTSIEYRHN